MQDTIKTIFGNYVPESKKRLDLTYDYETCAVLSFRDIVAHIGATQVVDIGANIGIYSVFTSGLPSVRKVYAFEPAPESAALLKKNVAIQSVSEKISIYEFALSDHAGEATFNIISPMSGANAIVSSEGGRAGTFVTIQTKPLDDVLPFSGEIVAVKIDVEGHEPATLSGAKNFIRSNKCFVQVESLRPETLESVREFMADVGYDHVFSLRDDHLYVHPHFKNDAKHILDIIAKNLAPDLRNLTELRLEKRRIAAEAKKLWHAAGYQKDPLLG